jgi:hypothetical protein
MSQIITFRDLCARFPLCEPTLRGLVRDGSIPRVRLTRRKWLFDAEVVEAALRQAGAAVAEQATPTTASDQENS